MWDVRGCCSNVFLNQWATLTSFCMNIQKMHVLRANNESCQKCYIKMVFILKLPFRIRAPPIGACIASAPNYCQPWQDLYFVLFCFNKKAGESKALISFRKLICVCTECSWTVWYIGRFSFPEFAARQKWSCVISAVLGIIIFFLIKQVRICQNKK